MQKVILSNILNPQSPTKCDVIFDGALILKKKKNSWIIDKTGKSSVLLKDIQGEVIDLSDYIIMPSFFDMHFHWVQDDVRMMPKDQLLTWLEKYTFPTEAKFKDKKYAKEKAKSFFKKLVSTGTLGGAIYSSVHGHALEYAMKEAIGDFIIGNVQMTINSPKYLKQTSKQAINLAAKFSAKYQEKYALTPRFAIATDPKTMKESARIVKRNKSFMQTHLSENKEEIEFVNSLYKEHMPGFSKVKNYTDIYRKVGLLGKKTIMGHGIHLSPDELKTLSETKTAIAHCPTSNAPHKQLGLGSGLFDYKNIDKHNISWALASDIGGGPFLSMFDVMRSFVEQNKKANVKASYINALYRSTLAGAKILQIDKSHGNLSKNKFANFIAIKKPRSLNGVSAKNAHIILEKTLSPYKAKRSQLDKIVDFVFYKGELIYSKKSSTGQ